MVTQTNTNSYNISVLLLDGCVNGGCSFTHVSDDRGELRAVDPVEPFVLDLDGDRVPELVFVKGNVRHVAIFKDLGVGVREFDSFVNKPNNTEGFPIYPAVVYPQLDQHYASLVDVDGDCMTDLVLISGNSTSKYLEFYTNLQNGLLSQPKFVPISSNVKSMSFTDISTFNLTQTLTEPTTSCLSNRVSQTLTASSNCTLTNTLLTPTTFVVPQPSFPSTSDSSTPAPLRRSSA